MPQKIQKAILPFGSLCQTDIEPLVKGAERAAIFCLAEMGRNKGSGFFRRKPQEKLLFITLVYYPCWLLRFGDFAILFDGLNLASHSMTYAVLPDIVAFKSSLKAHSETRQVYVNFLADHLNYFQGSNVEETKVIDGLITDEDFLRDFMSYFKDATITEDPIVESVLISPANNEASVQSIAKSVEELQLKFVDDISELKEIIGLLNLKTQEVLKSLHKEVKVTESKFSEQIKKAKASLEGETSQINKEYAEKVTDISTKFESEVVALQKEIIVLEKTKERIESEIERCGDEIKTATVDKDDLTVQQWKEKKDELKKELPEILSKIKDLEEKIPEIEENKKTMIFQLKSEIDNKLKHAAKDLMEIESSRDAELKKFQGEMENIEELTLNIIGRVDKLEKTREAVISEFDTLCIKQKNINPTLVYLPFYLICYQLGENKRYTFFAPSLVNSMNFSAKLRGSLGEGKITRLLQPRSKKIVSLLNKFAVLMDENIVFSHEVIEACRKANLLETPNLRESIMTGLDDLKEDGWLSEKECVFYKQIIT